MPDSSSPPPILTPRLLLRVVRDSDAPAMHALRSRVDIMKWSVTRTPDASLAATRAHMARWTEPHNLCFVVLRRDPTPPSPQAAAAASAAEPESGSGVVDGVIGSVGVFVGGDHVEVGYMVHPSAWGHGFATEAVRAAMDAWWEGYAGTKEAAEEHISAKRTGVDVERSKEVRVLRAETYPGNEPSYRVLRKCGFERVGVERDEKGEFEVWECER